MSITFMLNAPQSVLTQVFPPIEVALINRYPNLVEELYEESDTDHVLADEYFTHARGWCCDEPTAPELHCSNCNAFDILHKLGIAFPDYVGQWKPEDLPALLEQCDELKWVGDSQVNGDFLRFHHLATVVRTAINHNWGVYWA